ncbi:MAG TPA: DUF4389 domain-containing protein [Solirubrobacterales bacterium]|nr:DUF4389 domain-containing protein [Solirubrobacterales bacterium]
MYPISYEADAVLEGRNRLTTFFRGIVVIPWQIVQYFYAIAAQIAAFIAWFAIVFTGRYPQGIYDFNAGFLRMSTRVNSFYYLLNDEWPPFGGEEAPDYPVRVGIAPPLDAYSRLKTGFRFIVGIPVMLLAVVQGLILFVCVIIAWFAILFTGRLAEGLFTPMRSAMAYLTRAIGYFLLLTEEWPPFSYEEGTAPAAGEISREAASRKS